jgi:hypothetical protein
MDLIGMIIVSNVSAKSAAYIFRMITPKKEVLGVFKMLRRISQSKRGHILQNSNFLGHRCENIEYAITPSSTQWTDGGLVRRCYKKSPPPLHLHTQIVVCTILSEARSSVVVKALRYKLEGLRIETR